MYLDAAERILKGQELPRTAALVREVDRLLSVHRHVRFLDELGATAKLREQRAAWTRLYLAAARAYKLPSKVKARERRAALNRVARACRSLEILFPRFYPVSSWARAARKRLETLALTTAVLDMGTKKAVERLLGVVVLLERPPHRRSRERQANEIALRKMGLGRNEARRLLAAIKDMVSREDRIGPLQILPPHRVS